MKRRHTLWLHLKENLPQQPATKWKRCAIASFNSQEKFLAIKSLTYPWPPHHKFLTKNNHPSIRTVQCFAHRMYSLKQLSHVFRLIRITRKTHNKTTKDNMTNIESNIGGNLSIKSYNLEEKNVYNIYSISGKVLQSFKTWPSHLLRVIAIVNF